MTVESIEETFRFISRFPSPVEDLKAVVEHLKFVAGAGYKTWGATLRSENRLANFYAGQEGRKTPKLWEIIQAA